MMPSAGKEMLIRAGSNDFEVRLANAQRIEVVPYHAGFKTGVKERTTFADGTTVTVDWDAQTAKIEPEL